MLRRPLRVLQIRRRPNIQTSGGGIGQTRTDGETGETVVLIDAEAIAELNGLKIGDPDDLEALGELIGATLYHEYVHVTTDPEYSPDDVGDPNPLPGVCGHQQIHYAELVYLCGRIGGLTGAARDKVCDRWRVDRDGISGEPAFAACAGTTYYSNLPAVPNPIVDCPECPPQ